MSLDRPADDARIIPISKSAEEARAHHKPNVIKPWMGDSVGWWEGDTLVVETTNFNTKGSATNQAGSGYLQGIRQSEALRVVERFTRVSAENTATFMP